MYMYYMYWFYTTFCVALSNYVEWHIAQYMFLNVSIHSNMKWKTNVLVSVSNLVYWLYTSVFVWLIFNIIIFFFHSSRGGEEATKFVSGGSTYCDDSSHKDKGRCLWPVHEGDVRLIIVPTESLPVTRV